MTKNSHIPAPVTQFFCYWHLASVWHVCYCPVAQSWPTLRPHGLQHARFLCPSPSAGACSNSCPLSRWCHPAISSSVACFASCPQSFPASGSNVCMPTQCVISDSLQPWARQAPLSMGFSRQECWSGLPFPYPGDLLTQGSNSGFLRYRQIFFKIWATRNAPGNQHWCIIVLCDSVMTDTWHCACVRTHRTVPRGNCSPSCDC